MKRVLAVFLGWSLFVDPFAMAAVRGHKSMYATGTLTTCKPGQMGTLAPSDAALVFTPEGNGTAMTISYDSITAMDYGEHAGRRVGSTIALGVTTLGVMALPMLFSKKKRHYLTVYLNADPKLAAQQREEMAKNPSAAPKGDVAAFQVNKHDYADMISVLQAKTGLKVQEEKTKR